VRGRVANLDVLARRVAEQVNDATVVVLVCGSAPSATVLRTAASRFGADVRVLVVRTSRAEPVSCRAVGSATVITLNDLDDLPAAVRRAGSL
jgi:glycine cleavage system regulatory protein